MRRRALVLFVVVLLPLVSTALASASKEVSLRSVYASVRQAGFANVVVFSNLGRIDHPAATLDRPVGGPYMVAVDVYRPRFGPVSAVWFHSIKAARHLIASEQWFLQGHQDPRVIPPDIHVARIREVRVCNVVVTTGNYPAQAPRFARLVALVRRNC